MAVNLSVEEIRLHETYRSARDARGREDRFFTDLLWPMARRNGIEVEELDPLTVAIYAKGWWCE